MRYGLVIIDMQQGSFIQATPRHDARGLVRRINAVASSVRAKGGLVIFVQHDGPIGDAQHPDEPGWQLLPDLHVHAADCKVRKTACDSFLGTSLENELASGSIQDLIVTGRATDYVVDTTVRSALARDYRTTVPRDGHATADRRHLSARQIIEHHNAIWADFIAPGGPARVCPCNEIFTE